MTDFAKEIVPISLVDEMRNSYLDYAMSVIVGRALPDARDGLKPVHRRILFSMHKNNNAWNKKYSKSATIVGDVMGKYHPHGDGAIYDTLVRMAQPFSLRYMLIDGQGNFGSVDGDPPAAMRYTESRMTKIAHNLLTDIEKETVNFAPNYDNSTSEPVVLPTRLPNLLINGGSGIAVGMATNIPPHNLNETLNACLCLLDNPDANVDDLMQHLPAPDFPTGGIINGIKGVKEAYETGRGRIFLRAKTHIETEKNGKQTIVVDELPYQVNKARLLEKIGSLVKEKKIAGVSALRDESDKDGIRMVVEVKRGESAEILLNQLFQLTQLQISFGINMVALVANQPKLLSLKELLTVFIAHRREVVTRRTIFDLNKARERAHILEGLFVALANIDEIIALIRSAKSPSEAKEKLLSKGFLAGQVEDLLSRANADCYRTNGISVEYGLREGFYYFSPEQAQAILDLRLHRLTGLEQDKIISEFKDLVAAIEGFLQILQNPVRLTEVVREELVEIQQQFNDVRKTEILSNRTELSTEDLIVQEDLVITISHEDYIKAQPLSDYNAQKRGGKGKVVTAVKDDDFVEQLFVANTHDNLLCFSNKGKVYWLKAYEVPQSGRAAKGKPIINLLPFGKDERLNAILPVREYADDQFLLFATKSGTVKKTPLSEYSNQRSSGIIAISLRNDDELVGVALTDGNQDVMLFSNEGKAVRFNEQDVRSAGRGAAGVRGMRLDENHRLIALCVVQKEGDILTVTENGYGKRTPISEYISKGRGGKGIISIVCSERNGEAVNAVQVCEKEEIMLVTENGTMVRTRVAEIAVSGRVTQGVRLIRTSGTEKVIDVAKIVIDENNESS